MKTIFKYPINERWAFVVSLPKDARFLTLRLQQNFPQMWFEIDTEKESVERTFIVFGTGMEIPEGCEYLGTYLSPGENFVWHLYELKDGKI